MTDIENRMANDRCWPEPKPLTRDERIDEYTRAAMFSTYDWLDDLTHEECKSLLAEVVHACWRLDGFLGMLEATSFDRISKVKAALESEIDRLAEEKANEQE